MATQALPTKIITPELSEASCVRHKMPMKAVKMPDFAKRKFLWVCTECNLEQEKKFEAEEAVRQAQERQLRINHRLENAMISPRFQDKTFENYKAESVGQMRVLNQVRKFVDKFDSSTGLIFTGKPGTGKNHLASALVKLVIEQRNKTALMTTALKLIRAIKESWNGGSEKTTIMSFVGPDLLVIDEVGVQFKSDTERLYLTEIINDRYEWRRPTILLTNATLKELGEMVGDRVIDRFRDGGEVLVFDWESHRGKHQ